MDCLVIIDCDDIHQIHYFGSECLILNQFFSLQLKNSYYEINQEINQIIIITPLPPPTQ